MRVFGVLLILACTTSVTVSGQKAAEVDTANIIRALEHEWVDAQARNDNQALDLIFDNALVYVEYGNLVTKGEYLSRIKRAGPQVSQIVTESMTVRTAGKTSIVVGAYRETESKAGRSSVKHWRFIDTWVDKKSGWVLVAASAAPISGK